MGVGCTAEDGGGRRSDGEGGGSDRTRGIGTSGAEGEGGRTAGGRGARGAGEGSTDDRLRERVENGGGRGIEQEEKTDEVSGPLDW